MKKIYARSLVAGFFIGTLFFTIAPLGLGISAIEVLKPVLTPGILLTQLITGSGGGALVFIMALVLNGAVFSALILIWSLLRQRSNSDTGQ